MIPIHSLAFQDFLTKLSALYSPPPLAGGVWGQGELSLQDREIY
jgi:hypothetical protein